MAPKKDKNPAKPNSMPPADTIKPPKVRTFTAVTNMGNKFTELVKMADEDQKLQLFLDGVHDSIKELVSISFERAEINDLITNKPEFQKLQFFDPSAIFNAESNALKTGQVMSILTDIQTKCNKSAFEPSKKVVDRLEKVRY